MKQNVMPKKCPFCGGYPTIMRVPLWHGDHGYHGCYEISVKCECPKCTVRPETRKLNTIGEKDENKLREQAIAEWNNRK